MSHSRLPLQGQLDTRVFRWARQGSQQNQAAVSEWGKRASGQQCLPLRRERRAVTAASETRVGEALLVAVHVFIDRKRDPLDTPVEWTEMGPGQLKSKPGTRKNTAVRGGPFSLLPGAPLGARKGSVGSSQEGTAPAKPAFRGGGRRGGRGAGRCQRHLGPFPPAGVRPFK